MDQIEKQLLEGKKHIDSINAPEELEGRLRNALQTQAIPKSSKRIVPPWTLVAVALCLIVIISYQYNAFAYYGKKLLGFDEVISGTLKELNDEGMGQIVDKTTILADGTSLTIDGIMADDNQLILYYTLNNPDGLEDNGANTFSPFNITGFLTKSYHESGTSLMNEDYTEVKGMYTFESVSPFSKKLTLNFSQELHNGRLLDESISFSYKPNQAMQTSIKQKINKTVAVDQGEVTFKNITASSMSTIIKGKLNVKNFDRTNIGMHGIELIANGSPVELIGSGSRSALGGTNFEIRYDGLPEPLDSLRLVMKEFVGYRALKEKLSLSSSGKELFMLGDKELWVKNITSTNDRTEITIATDEDVMLDGVSIETENESIPLKTTVRQDYLEQENGKTMKERTLIFETKLEPKHLLIEGIHYEKVYHHMIEMPID